MLRVAPGISVETVDGSLIVKLDDSPSVPAPASVSTSAAAAIQGHAAPSPPGPSVPASLVAIHDRLVQLLVARNGNEQLGPLHQQFRKATGANIPCVSAVSGRTIPSHYLLAVCGQFVWLVPRQFGPATGCARVACHAFAVMCVLPS